MENKKAQQGSGIIFAVIGIVLLVAAAAVSGYLYYKYQKIERNTVVPPQTPVGEDTSNPASKTSSQVSGQISETTAVRSAEGDILWNQPQQIPSLKLFKVTQDLNREGGAEYYKIGEFTAGKYQGGEIILVSAYEDGPVNYPGFYRFAKVGDSLYSLKKYSDELYDADSFIRTKFSIDETYTIPALEFPKTIAGLQPRQVLVLQVGINVFFKSDKLKKGFTDRKLGDVYTTAGYPKPSSDIFERYGFYVKAPDGKVAIYALEPDFLGENNLPQITWNDGTQNENDYAFTDSGGCGSTDYVAVISPDEINIANDLRVAGKNSKGDTIYELKDQKHKLLKDFYDNGYAVYNGQKVSYADFLVGRPLFFWVDPFGRLIKFQSKQFGPAVECGKPVIYLYPEKSEQVSVKIEPKGGLTYSEPAYNNGWLVNADTSSNLTEVSSGKTYPYLFWEGKGGIYESPKKGFVVRKGNVHDFLIEKLAKLGLNQKETADFIEFWEPRMQSSPYYFVSFLGNREMDQIAPLTIAPKPDTVIRVLMDFSPLEKPVAVQGYKIKTPVRNGFTVVEWGGVIK